MPATRTLQQIRDDARFRADAVGDGNVTDAQLNDWINDAIAELWDMLVEADPDRYYRTSTITTTAGTQSYALPEDFYQVRRVDRISSGRRIMVEPFLLQEVDTDTDVRDPELVRYRVMGAGIDGTAARLYLMPDPGGGSYELHYVQAPQRLVNNADAFDGAGGWELYVVLHVAIAILGRQERDTTYLERERARVEQRIRAMARKRDSGRAPRIADVRSGRRWREREYY